MGSEDIPNPFYFFLDVLFYISSFWLIERVIQIMRGKERLVELKAMWLPWAVWLACLLLGVLLYLPFLIQ